MIQLLLFLLAVLNENWKKIQGSKTFIWTAKIEIQQWIAWIMFEIARDEAEAISNNNIIMSVINPKSGFYLK